MKHFLLSRYTLGAVLCMAAGAATAAAPTEPKRLKPEAKALLIEIGQAGENGMMVDETTDAFKTLIKAGWLYVDTAKRNGNSIATILSPTGKTKFESVKPSETTRAPRGPALKPEDFEVMSGVAMPDFQAARRVARQVYPFDKLTAVGQSFFIPAPEDFPADKDYGQARQGTVGAQNRKLKEDWEAQPVDTRGEAPVQFKVQSYEHNGKRGAMVWRVS